MDALRIRCLRCVLQRWLLSSFFFPRLFSLVGDWMSTILRDTGRGLSLNLECMSEMCCTRLAGNTGRKND